MSSERWQEFVLGVLALVWAIALAMPEDIFGRLPAYAFINRFMPDEVWALILTICGLVILIFPFTPCRENRGRIFWRAQAHAVLGILRFLIAFLVLSGGLKVSAVLVASPFVALAALHVFEFFKLSQLAKL